MNTKILAPSKVRKFEVYGNINCFVSVFGKEASEAQWHNFRNENHQEFLPYYETLSPEKKIDFLQYIDKNYTE